MKNKITMLLSALMICMSVFIFPITAHATSDSTPPDISAKLTGEVLHIEASDADSGVEAVFINGNRINYRVDGALDVIFKVYSGTGEYTPVYAIDFAGNKSKTVNIKNPFYAASSSTPATSQPTSTTEPAETPDPTESQVPSEPKPFTPDGTGTVQDNATDGDGKEFFTIVTPDENVFYLIIDRQRDSENVYLLNTVTEEDLAALADKSKGTTSQCAIPTPDPTEKPEPTPTPDPEPEPEPEPAKTSTGTIIFILIAVAAAGGAGYYFKILKPKQQAQGTDEFDDDDDDDFDYGDSDSDEPDDDDDFYYPDEDDLSGDTVPDDED